MTDESEKELREHKSGLHSMEFKECSICAAIEELDSLREKLKINEFRLKHIHENTECIGALKGHADGNCIHCLAVPAIDKVKNQCCCHDGKTSYWCPLHGR